MKFLPLAFLLGCTTTDPDLVDDINSVHEDLTEINATLDTVLQLLNDACEADPNCTLPTTTTTGTTSTDVTGNVMPLVSTPATTTGEH